MEEYSHTDGRNEHPVSGYLYVYIFIGGDIVSRSHGNKKRSEF